VVSLVAFVLLGINTLQAGFACHSENVYCAYSASKDGVYTGALRGTGSPHVVEASFGLLLRSSVPLDVAPDGSSGPTNGRRRRQLTPDRHRSQPAPHTSRSAPGTPRKAAPRRQDARQAR
jgi:hypothetical protein